MNPNRKTVVLVFSGHDPVGGAGIQADIEAITSSGSHALTVITALTSQNTHNAVSCEPVSRPFIERQTRELVRDIRVDAIKIGLIPNAELTIAISAIIRQFPQLPIVFDPVAVAGGGAPLTQDPAATLEAIRGHLLPQVSLILPNTPELLQLSAVKQYDTDNAARVLLDLGCQRVLVTGGHELSDPLTNHLYQRDGTRQDYHYPRLKGRFHGSGCTLAARCAALLAQGIPILTAIKQAQDYTWNCLAHAYSIDKSQSGQSIPNRVTQEQQL